MNGIVPGSLAGTVGTLDLPVGLYRYHSIQFIYIDGTGTPTDITAMFGDLALYRNGQVERLHSSLELDHLNGLNGSQYQRQQVGTGAAMRQTQTIFFAEPWRYGIVNANTGTVTESDAMAWSVDAPNGFRTFQLKATLLATFPATGSIICQAYVDAPVAPPKAGPAWLKKVYRIQIPASGTALDVTNLDARDTYQTISLKHPAASYIMKTTVKLNGNFILESANVSDNYANLVGRNLNPANSTTSGNFGFDVVFDYDDPLNSALPAQGQNLWMHLDFAAAASGNVIALIERLGPLD